MNSNIVKRGIVTLVLCLGCGGVMWGQSLGVVNPLRAGIDPGRLVWADRAIEEAVAAGDIPGAVVAVVRGDHLVHLKAFGYKQLWPDTVAMTTGTVFDLASLSKSVSTAVCAMILVERGQLRLRDRVEDYIPGFEPWKDSVTGKVRHIRIVDLLTHTAGLPPYAQLAKLEKQYPQPNADNMIDYISKVKRGSEPGTSFDYSCLGFITLGRIVEKVSGMSLRDFAMQNIFAPLGMRHTDYNPTGETLARVAPTQRQPDGSVLRGSVHDPLARVMMGGVSGNAGLFSSAEDLAVFAAMVLGGGRTGGVRVLGPLTVKAMRSIPMGYEAFGRSLGWDLHSGYAAGGDLFGAEAFGHTGYTGTSMVIDPDSATAVILLTARVHPDDGGKVGRLRDLVANVVAASILK